MYRNSQVIVMPIVLTAILSVGQSARPAEDTDTSMHFYPKLVTEQTRSDPQALERLQRPGELVLQDDFESEQSWKKYFEIQGAKEGLTRLTNDPAHVFSGRGALQVTAPNRQGKSSGAGVIGWLGPEGYDRLYMRYYMKFAEDYDQGNLNHTGGGLSGIAGRDRYFGMGKAGIRPEGNDRFSTRFEPWRDWGRYEPPGYMFLYTYWMDMRRDRDGNYWGNNMVPEENQRVTIKRGRWYCFELMVAANTIGRADGELAAWIDGQLYIHYTGFRWRSAADVRLKRFELIAYIHQSRRDNTVWYDDLAISTGYLGPMAGQASNSAGVAAPPSKSSTDEQRQRR